MHFAMKSGLYGEEKEREGNSYREFTRGCSSVRGHGRELLLSLSLSLSRPDGLLAHTSKNIREQTMWTT